jgi:hypothetical protein
MELIRQSHIYDVAITVHCGPKRHSCTKPALYEPESTGSVYSKRQFSFGLEHFKRFY